MPVAAAQIVVILSAHQGVVSCSADKSVVSCSAADGIIAEAAFETVVPVIASQRVIMTRASQVLDPHQHIPIGVAAGARAGIQAHRHRIAGIGIKRGIPVAVAAVQGVRAVAAVQFVIAAVSNQAVVAAQAAQRVIGLGPFKRVIQRRAGPEDAPELEIGFVNQSMINANQVQSHGLACRSDPGIPAGVLNHKIGEPLGAGCDSDFIDAVLEIIDHIIRKQAEHEQVAARIASERVSSALARKRVIPGPARKQVGLAVPRQNVIMNRAFQVFDPRQRVSIGIAAGSGP